MESVRHLPTFSLYVLVLLLHYLAWWEQQLKQATRRAHWIGGERPEWVYPERKKYIVQILKYRILIWLSVHTAGD